MKNRNRVLALLLAVILCVSLLPLGALADEEATEEESLSGEDLVVNEEAASDDEMVFEEDADTDVYEESFDGEVYSKEEESSETEEPVETAEDPELTNLIDSEVLGTMEALAAEEALVLDGAASGTCGDDLTWTLSDDGVLTISGAGAMYDYTYSNPAPWYSYRSSIKSVVIGSGVTSIGEWAFYNCSSLTSVTIPDSVTSIGDDAFCGCSLLTSITIPDGVTSIGNYAFNGCSSLTSITIPDSVTSIGNYAFADCSALTSITIPDSVTSIGNYAFADCSALTSITIPDSVTSIGSGAFYNCSSLTNITIPAGVTSIGEWAFYNCSSLTSIVIPAGVTSIGYGSFRYCSSLTSIVIPAGVTSIGDKAFYYCSSLTSIVIPAGVTSIGEWAFHYCSSLTSVTIPDSVTSIGSDAFYSCSSLTSITIPEGVTSIGSYAFVYCTSLTSITIGSGVTSIGDKAFYNCSSLTSITFEGSAPTIGSNAFYGVTATAYYPADDVSWTSDVMQDYGGTITWVAGDSGDVITPSGTCGDNLTWTLSDDGVLAISGTGAMADYSNNSAPWYPYQSSIASVTVSDGVTSIGDGAFADCSALTSITILASVTDIGESAFYGCVSLTDVYYAGSEEDWSEVSIGEGNDALTSATIHYNYTGSGSDDTEERTVTYSDYSVQFGSHELSISSLAGVNNKNMSVLCAMLSDASYSSEGTELRELYRQMFDGCEWDLKFDYDDYEFCSGIALGEMRIDGVDTDVLVITVRGTDVFSSGSIISSEAIADISSDTTELWGYGTYQAIADFESTIMSRLNTFLADHDDIGNKPLKVIITGHSLGGAAANLLAARFTKFANGGAWWSPVVSQADIYAYTFGAIDSLNVNLGAYGVSIVSYPIKSGYENIHNIYNITDTFGPYGNKLITAAGNSMVGKYGHIDLFAKDFATNELFGEHMMSTYLKATALSYVPENKYNYTRVWVRCPVDVEVYENGILVGRICDNTIDSNVTTIDIDMVVIDDAKCIVYPSDKQLEICLTATDEGLLEYSIETMFDEYTEIKTFIDVALVEGKELLSEVGGDIAVKDVVLYVTDEQGAVVSEVQEDGTEVKLDHAQVLGDVDGDGEVTGFDASLILQYEVGLIDESGLDLSVADVDGDGEVTGFDASLILQYEVGLIDEFTA